MSQRPLMLNYASAKKPPRKFWGDRLGWILFCISGVISVIGCCVIYDIIENRPPHHTRGFKEPPPIEPVVLVLIVLGFIMFVASAIVEKPPTPLISITMGLAPLLFVLGILILT